jgi:hypothetical protein
VYNQQHFPGEYQEVPMTTFTLVHVVLSLVGIGSGLVVTYGTLRGKPMDGGTALFLATTVLTSVTGFFFPFHKLLPSHIVGIISLGCWRWRLWPDTSHTWTVAGVPLL